MTRYLAGGAVFMVGLILGALGHYLLIHSKVDYSNDASELVSKVLLYSGQEITQENDNCEGADNQNVGDVLSSIVGASLAFTVNPLSASCEGHVCSIVMSNCQPWQDSECGSRLLIFDTELNGNIVPSSFKCLDIP